MSIIFVSSHTVSTQHFFMEDNKAINPNNLSFLNRIFRGDKVVWLVFMILMLISIVEV